MSMEPRTACSPSREWGICRRRRSSFAILMSPRSSAPSGGGIYRGPVMGRTPHFSFVLPKEKRAVRGPKRKAFCRASAPSCLRADGGLPNQCRRKPSVFCRLAPDRSLVPALRRVFAASVIGVENRMAPAPESACRSMVPGRKASGSGCAAVGGFAALRWTAVRGFAALRMSRPPCGRCGVPLAGTAHLFPPKSRRKRRLAPTRVCGRSLFDVSNRGPRRAPRGGERRRSGGSETWPCGPGRTIRSLCRRQWGVG